MKKGEPKVKKGMSPDEIRARIAMLESQREQFAAQANIQIGRFTGQIELLQEMLKSAEGEPGTTDITKKRPASEANIERKKESLPS